MAQPSNDTSESTFVREAFSMLLLNQKYIQITTKSLFLLQPTSSSQTVLQKQNLLEKIDSQVSDFEVFITELERSCSSSQSHEIKTTCSNISLNSASNIASHCTSSLTTTKPIRNNPPHCQLTSYYSTVGPSASISLPPNNIVLPVRSCTDKSQPYQIFDPPQPYQSFDPPPVRQLMNTANLIPAADPSQMPFSQSKISINCIFSKSSIFRWKAQFQNWLFDEAVIINWPDTAIKHPDLYHFIFHLVDGFTHRILDPNDRFEFPADICSAKNSILVVLYPFHQSNSAPLLDLKFKLERALKAQTFQSEITFGQHWDPLIFFLYFSEENVLIDNEQSLDQRSHFFKMIKSRLNKKN